MTPAQLAVLKTEIALPAYNRMGDEAIADQLNNVRDRTIDVETLDNGALAASLVTVDISALSAVQRIHLQIICSTPAPFTANLRAQLQGMFPQGSATRTNFLAYMQRDGSRAEELKIYPVTPSDVANARRLP